MIINIISPNRINRDIELSNEMKNHFDIPINHAHTILNQINGGMYSLWFEGKKDLVCMDFGANVGLVSLYMTPACKRIYCVEPTPSHYALMKGLLQANNGETEIMLSDFALTEKEEEVIFATGHATENKITSEGGYGNNKITVQGKPLSWFLNDIGEVVDFCKVDIEGGEIFALTEEELRFAHGKVKVFFVEAHPSNNYSMDSCMGALTNRFKAAGYRVEYSDYQTIVAYES